MLLILLINLKYELRTGAESWGSLSTSSIEGQRINKLIINSSIPVTLIIRSKLITGAIEQTGLFRPTILIAFSNQRPFSLW